MELCCYPKGSSNILQFLPPCDDCQCSGSFLISPSSNRCLSQGASNKLLSAWSIVNTKLLSHSLSVLCLLSMMHKQFLSRARKSSKKDSTPEDRPRFPASLHILDQDGRQQTRPRYHFHGKEQLGHTCRTTCSKILALKLSATYCFAGGSLQWKTSKQGHIAFKGKTQKQSLKGQISPPAQ